ncbi:hypothetical protein PV325_008931 [Microctonus aethiopoides]|nr:hypothetical protein PV325_008931 [Microctonus aethiopoides]
MRGQLLRNVLRESRGVGTARRGYIKRCASHRSTVYVERSVRATTVQRPVTCDQYPEYREVQQGRITVLLRTTSWEFHQEPIVLFRTQEPIILVRTRDPIALFRANDSSLHANSSSES